MIDTFGASDRGISKGCRHVLDPIGSGGTVSIGKEQKVTASYSGTGVARSGWTRVGLAD
jgi:hypothetical protein